MKSYIFTVIWLVISVCWFVIGQSGAGIGSIIMANLTAPDVT